MKKELQKQLSVDEAQKIIKSAGFYDLDIRNIFADLCKGIIQKGNTFEIPSSLRDKAEKAKMAFGLDTHYFLGDVLLEKHVHLATAFANQLIADYNCESADEKALVEVIAMAFARILVYTKILSGGLDLSFYAKRDDKFFEIAGKELDRANRHFLSALAVLRQLKSLPIELNINTKNAFISQNQQINTNKTEKQ